MSRARQIVIGLNTKGKYIVVSLSRKGISIKAKALHKLNGAELVMFNDAVVEVSGSYYRRDCIIKTVLAAFEPELPVYNSAKISGITRIGSTVIVTVKTEVFLPDSKAFWNGVLGNPEPSFVTVKFSDVEEFLGDMAENLGDICSSLNEDSEDLEYWDDEDYEEALMGDEGEDGEWSEEDFEEALIDDEDYCDECDECEDGDFEDDFEYHDDYYFMDNDEYEEEFSTDEEDLEEPFETTEDLLSSLFPGYEVEDDSPDEFVTPEFEEIGNNRGTSEVSKHSSKSKNKKKRKRNSGRRS